MDKEDQLKKVLMYKAINDQMDRYVQENGAYPSKSYSVPDQSYIPTGYEDEVNQKVIYPAILDSYDSPEQFILQSEDYLQNRFKKSNKAPSVDYQKSVMDRIFPKRTS